MIICIGFLTYTYTTPLYEFFNCSIVLLGNYKNGTNFKNLNLKVMTTASYDLQPLVILW